MQLARDEQRYVLETIKWIPCGLLPPPTGRRILIRYVEQDAPGGVRVTAASIDDDGEVWLSHRCTGVSVALSAIITHWSNMPTGEI